MDDMLIYRLGMIYITTQKYTCMVVKKNKITTYNLHVFFLSMVSLFDNDLA